MELGIFSKKFKAVRRSEAQRHRLGLIIRTVS